MTPSDPSQQKRRKRRFDPVRIGIRQAAKDLGISESCLRKWTTIVDATGKQSLLPMNQRTDLEAEDRRLREELRVLKRSAKS